MTTLKQNFFHFFILLPIGFILFLYANIGTYNRLLGDSLCSFYYAERLGLLRSIWYWRITWSGRYSAYAFDWLTTKFFDSQTIIWFTPLVIIFWLFVNSTLIFLLLKSKAENKNHIRLSVLLGAASVFAMLTLIPSIEQSIFWVDGFRAYTLPIIILPIFFCGYFIFSDKIKSKFLASCLTFLLFFASGGLSETFAVFQFCLLAFWIATYWLLERPKSVDKNLFILIAGLLGAMTAIVVVASAYGNVVRQSFSPPPVSLFEIIQISSKAYFDFLSGIIFTPQKATALFGVIFLSVWAGSLYQSQFSNHKNKIILQVFGALVLSFVCFPPGVYGYSEPPS